MIQKMLNFILPVVILNNNRNFDYWFVTTIGPISLQKDNRIYFCILFSE